jgi:hypothetical protein
VNLVDEQHVIRLEVRQYRGEVSRPFEHGPGRLPEIDPHLVSHDMGQRRLAQTRRPENQHVVECFAAPPRRLDEYAHLLLDARLAHVLG